MDDTRMHWECDKWDDNPAATGGSKKPHFGAVVIVPVHAEVVSAVGKEAARQGITPAQLVANATGQTVLGTPPQKLTLFQKILRFVEHPVKTIKGMPVPATSGMHGLPSYNNTVASQYDQPSFFQGTGNAFGDKPTWWENPLENVREWD